ncbi:uncharacterized protein [Physcomitrium patens]
MKSICCAEDATPSLCCSPPPPAPHHARRYSRKLGTAQVATTGTCSGALPDTLIALLLLIPPLWSPSSLLVTNSVPLPKLVAWPLFSSCANAFQLVWTSVRGEACSTSRRSRSRKDSFVLSVPVSLLCWMSAIREFPVLRMIELILGTLISECSARRRKFRGTPGRIEWSLLKRIFFDCYQGEGAGVLRRSLRRQLGGVAGVPSEFTSYTNMSIEVAVTAAPSNGGVANTSRIGLEAGGNNTRNERKAGKGTGVQEPAYSPASCSRGSLYYSETSNILNVIYCWYPWRGRRRRHAAEQRRIEQQRWGQYVEEEDEGYSVVLPSPPNSRRRARRSSRRNCAQDDLQECLNELENDDYVTGLDDNLDLHLALALSVSITEQSSIAHVQHIGSSHVSVVADMTYESLVQLEDVRCVASSAVVAALPVCCISIEGAAPVGQASEMCLICLGEYEHGDTQVKLPCHHGFHQACGAEWLLNYSKLCPVCKLDVTESAPIEATTCV